jgi:hypothetical protein
MIKLPKVNKVVGAGLTKLEKVKKVVVAAALGMSLGVLGTSASSASVSNEPVALSQTQATANHGALLLTPSVISGNQQQMAQHYSHSSHYSHVSHQSHYSHYSSRY